MKSIVTRLAMALGIATIAAVGQGVLAPASAHAADCGLTFSEQKYTVCGDGLRNVVLYYFDGFTKQEYSESQCWGPGTYHLAGTVPVGSLATTSSEGLPCPAPTGPPPDPPA